jgi:hypothetical protein
MAVGTKNPKILQPPVPSIAVTMVQRQHQLLSLPLRPESAYFTTVLDKPLLKEPGLYALGLTDLAVLHK